MWLSAVLCRSRPNAALHSLEIWLGSEVSGFVDAAWLINIEADFILP